MPGTGRAVVSDGSMLCLCLETTTTEMMIPTAVQKFIVRHTSDGGKYGSHSVLNMTCTT